MDVEGWRRIHDVFHAAMTRTAGERHAFLEEACLGDEALRQQLEQLLEAHERAGGFSRRRCSRTASVSWQPTISRPRLGDRTIGNIRAVLGLA